MYHVYKNIRFSKDHAVAARSSTVYGLRICDAITVRQRKTFYNDRGFLKYVCLDVSLAPPSP